MWATPQEGRPKAIGRINILQRELWALPFFLHVAHTVIHLWVKYNSLFVGRWLHVIG